MPTPTTAQRTYAMLANQSLWEVAGRVDGLLATRGIPYAIAGGVAVCLHGYRRNTVDLDLLISPDRADDVRAALVAGELTGQPSEREFRSPSGVPVQLLMAGESAGPGQPSRLPNPDDAASVTRIEGLPVLSLAALIEAKLACGLGDL